MRYAWLIALSLLTGCAWIGRQADHMGSYMPVIGERCEHWQCITESGRTRSEAIKQQRGQAETELKPLLVQPSNDNAHAEEPPAMDDGATPAS